MRINDTIIKTLHYGSNSVTRGCRVSIMYNGISRHYIEHVTYLDITDGASNSFIPRAIYGENYNHHASKIYGYDTIGGWPEYHSLKDLKKLLRDMEDKGAIITIL